MTGRPSKRTPEREQRLLEALRAGNTRRAACAYAEISEETFNQWHRRFPEFLNAVKKAEGDAEVRHVANIARAAQDGVWTASAWWLERRRPSDYGRRDRVELDVRRVAERYAADEGLDAAELIAEAEALVARYG